MIESILDNDLYKFSMGYAYMKLYPEAEGTFVFCDRNKEVFDNKYLSILKQKLSMLCHVGMSCFELDWVKKNISYIPEFYWEWLSTFKFQPEKIQVGLDKENHLQIIVVDKLYKVTLYEVPILALVSEGYYEWKRIKPNLSEVVQSTKAKAEVAEHHHFKFSEFGTRRRFSSGVQDTVIKVLSKSEQCTGTSNVYFAYKYNTKPMGTMAHEWIMFHGAHYGFLEANYLALEAWSNTYDGNLGIALTDTYTSNVFFSNLSMKQAKLFDGIRQDSGDEFHFTDKAIKRYKELGIDPLSKTIVFSNALNFTKAAKIAEYCQDKVKCSFGIGTNLTNDLQGVKPMNIVMKLMQCRMNPRQTWKSCIKISDDLGKVMGDEFEIQKAKHDLNL